MRHFLSLCPCHIHANHILLIHKILPHFPLPTIVHYVSQPRDFGCKSIALWKNSSMKECIIFSFTLNCSPVAPNFLSPEIINGLSFPAPCSALVKLPFSLAVDSHWNGGVKMFRVTEVPCLDSPSYDSVSDSLHCSIMPGTDLRVTSSKQTTALSPGAPLARRHNSTPG